MAGARLGSVNVIVEDVDALARFLDSLGLALESTPSEWAAHHRSYTADDAGFEAEFDTPARSPAGGGQFLETALLRLLSTSTSIPGKQSTSSIDVLSTLAQRN